jgi:hypothetical protein
MAYVQGLQRGAPVLQMSDYILLKQYGCCVPKYDRRVGYVTFQSGVTSDVTSGRRNINRRRMADYIQDSLAVAAMPFNKLVLTQQKKDAMLCEQDAFLGDLKSEGNPSLQRIADYVLDDKSMNTLSLARQNIYVIKHTVEMLMTGDTIVLNSPIGQGTIQVTAS